MAAFVCLACKRVSRAGTRGVSVVFGRRSHATGGFGLIKPM